MRIKRRFTFRSEKSEIIAFLKDRELNIDFGEWFSSIEIYEDDK